MSDAEPVRVEEPRPGVALVTLDRPERLNALSWPMIDRLLETFARLGADHRVRAIVLTGAGRGFCSGLDLSSQDEVGTYDDAITVLRRQERVASLATTLVNLDRPVIAAVNGPAAGGGMALALACDIRVLSEAGRMHVAFVRLGLSGCDVGVSWLLPRIVGLGMASELMLTGRQVAAEEALRIGLANRVVAPDELLDACLEIAGQIAANSPFAVWMTREVLHRNLGAGSLEAAIELENRTQVLATRTDDHREALDAFRERRPPRFGTR